MSRVLSLALKINADASGVRLTPVERALKRLGDETTKAGRVFEKFAKDSELGAQAQQNFAAQADRLAQSLKDRTITAQEYARAFAELSESAKEQAAALEEGRRVTESTRTTEEKRAEELERLEKLLQLNAITQETYNRAVAEASGANAAAAKAAAEAAAQQAEAERQRSSAVSRASQIIQSNLTAQERYQQQVSELRTLQQQGLLTQEQYNRAVASARKPLDDAAAAAERSAEANKASTLRFNELSGVFSVLPGPLGAIAGRISGIASAGEGLSRVFAGGLSQGVSSITSSFTALINPTTLAVAGIAGLGAAASGVVRGLIQLEDRVERLGNLAAQLGVSFEFVQVLEEAGNRTGVSIENVSSAFARLQRTLTESGEGSKRATEALQRLGVSVQQLETLTEDERIRLLGERIAGIEDPTTRATAAIELFGRSGVQLLPFFTQIGSAADDLERFGAAISDDDKRQIDEFGTAFDGVAVALRGLGQSVLIPFTRLITGLAKTFSGFVNVITGVAQAIGFVLRPVLDGLGVVFGEVGNAINGITGILRGFFGSVEQAAEATKPLEEAVQNAVKFDDGPAKRYAEAVQQISGNLREAFSEAQRFGQQGLRAAQIYSATIADLRRQFDERIITENTFNREVEKATEAYRKQIDVVRQLAAESERAAQAEREAVDRLIEANERLRRVQTQFGGDDARLRAAENLTLIYKEFERAEVELARARTEGDGDAIFALEQRIRLLGEAATRERDIASGRAAQRKAQEEEAARRIQQNQEIASRRLQAEREVERQIAAERDRVNQFVNEQLALAQFGGNQQRLQAARQVAEIEREIARVQTVVDQARQQGNTQVANAGVARIAQLDQVAAKERDIANGRAEVEARIQEQREKAVEAERLAAEQRQQAIEQQQQAAAQQAEAQRRAFEEQAKAAAAEAERQERRIRALNSIGQQSIGVGDIRSTEGANQFIQAAAGAFDPNLAELRAQSKLLRQIVLNSGALQYLETGIGSTFQFLGGGA